MKALHVLKTSKGASWAFLQIQALKELGIDVEVIVPDDGPMAKAYAEAGTRVHVIQTDIARLRSLRDFKDSHHHLMEILRQSKPDILHSHFVGTTIFLRLALRQIPAIPRLFQVPGPLHLENPLSLRADLYTAGESDSWVASCTETRRIYERAGVKPDRIGLSYYSIDFGHFSSSPPSRLRQVLGLPESTKLIGLVAYFYPPKRWLGYRRGIKGHEDLIEAARTLLDRGHDVACVFAGGAWEGGEGYQARVEAYARQRLGSRAFFLGHCEDVRAVYAALDLAVHPSLSENVGGASESLAMGIPTVGTSVGGIPDAVIDGVTGWLAKPGNPASLAVSIEDALSNPEEAKRRGKQGRKHIRALLDVSRNINELIKIYERATASVVR